MKTIINDKKDAIIRVGDSVAQELVDGGEWAYCPKGKFKEIKNRRNDGRNGKGLPEDTTRKV